MPVNPESEEPISADEQDLRKQAYTTWPRLGDNLKGFRMHILEAAYNRLSKLINRRYAKTKIKVLWGLQLDWNIQLRTFLRLQLKEERSWTKQELVRCLTDPITKRQLRKQLALKVANAAGWSKSVAEQILNHEVSYIRYGKQPASRKGKHLKVVSWLSDEGTILVMQEYMSQAGEG